MKKQGVEEAKIGEDTEATEKPKEIEEEDLPAREAEDLNEKIKERLKELIAETGVDPDSLLSGYKERVELRKVMIKEVMKVLITHLEGPMKHRVEGIHTLREGPKVGQMTEERHMKN